MSIENGLDSCLISINIDVERVDIKGQYISLAAPIRLVGYLNVSALLADYKIGEQQSFTAQDLNIQPLKIGVDEAGRGPLLGSVNVAATILPNAWSGLIEDQPLQSTPLSILTDSKQLSEKKRNLLYPLVKQHAIGYVIAEVPAAVIDQINILQATMLGMRLCTEKLLVAFASHIASSANNVTYNAPQELQVQVLYDGNRCPDLDYQMLAKSGLEQSAIDCQTWVKGDARHTSIAAASILAKVSRDQTMYKLDAQYPEYGIAQHKGYPTRAHTQALENHGVLDEHRRSFAPVRQALENRKII